MENEKLKLLNKNEIIPAYHFEAVKLRYQGMRYKQIRQELKIKFGIDREEQTIAYWFYKDGPLHKFYREYADLMIALEVEETRDFIRGNVSKAAKTLAAVMTGQGGPAQVMAAKEFLDRGIGKIKDDEEKPTEIKVNVNIINNPVIQLLTKQYEEKIKQAIYEQI